MTAVLGAILGSAAYLTVWRIATKGRARSPIQRNLIVALAAFLAAGAGLLVVLSDQVALMLGFAIGSTLTQLVVYRHKLMERFR
jgi:hypothetical protein